MNLGTSRFVVHAYLFYYPLRPLLVQIQGEYLADVEPREEFYNITYFILGKRNLQHFVFSVSVLTSGANWNFPLQS